MDVAPGTSSHARRPDDDSELFIHLAALKGVHAFRDAGLAGDHPVYLHRLTGAGLTLLGSDAVAHVWTDNPDGTTQGIGSP